ncbi:MAG TPA: polyprenyl synthetase family protein, partial [Anaerolineae bacterium]|nr:polyprenyl synthetase family protein [Anaerolineae bacterium]
MLTNTLEYGLEAVENQLQSIVDSDVQLLADAGLHIISSGGKRLRPQLAILAYLAAGGQDLDVVIPAAAA